MRVGKILITSVTAASMILSGYVPSMAAAGETAEVQADSILAAIDNTKWQYNQEDDVYWQVQIPYCKTPADSEYETLGIFVPGAYMNGTDNGDGTYTCERNLEGTAGGYTAADAPMVIPVDTPGYSAMAAPTDYVNGVSNYTNAGFIYVKAGCRGRDAGAPAGVTDLKAAVRYIRYNEGTIPGSTERIFTFGMSGGGAQSALMGATGDSELYTPYLEAIGAVEGYSDAVAGSMCWCPVTNLDYADEAYEWNLGSTRSGLDEETQELSDRMAEAYAEYINELGLTDEEGNVLTLTESEEGIYQAGTYYEYIKGVIEQSLNHFLSDTEFPYTSGGDSGRGDFGGRGDFQPLNGEGLPEELPEGMEKDFKGGKGARGEGKGGMNGVPEDLDVPKDDLETGEIPENEAPAGGFVDANGEFQEDGIARMDGGMAETESKTYETAQEYVDDLNADGEWVIYDSETNTATITSVAAFVEKCKNASKSVGAFDDLSIRGNGSRF